MIHRRTKPAADVVTYKVHFARALEVVWLPGVQFLLGDFVRPPVPNGYEFECTNAGQTAIDQPEWPAIGLTVNDGSVEWTGRDFGLLASDTIASRLVTPESGIDVDSDSISGTNVLVTLSGGTVGNCYDVAVKGTTTNGKQYTETLRITVIE